MRKFSKLLPASKLKLVISSIGIMILVAFSSLVLYEATKTNVTVSDNGMEESVKTHADTVEELLEEVNITVGEHDALSHSLNAAVENGMTIEYQTAKYITVTIDGEEKGYYTVADTVGAFLDDQGLSFSDRDDISHNSDEEIKDGLNLSVNQAFQVTINDGGEERKVWATGGSVQELLDSNEISLGEHDKIEPSMEEAISKRTMVEIVRVETKTEAIDEVVAFKTETKEDSSLEKGKKKVLAEGQDGKVTKTYEIVYENGKEVKRELVDEEVVQKSENRVVAVGTKQVQNLTTLSSGNKPSGGKEFTMTASAYTASCSGCSGYTSTGINLNANPNMKVIAVDSNVIPLGSKVWVEGYGEAIAGDTGGHIKGNRIDIHVPSKADAYSWGVRTVKVKIIK